MPGPSAIADRNAQVIRDCLDRLLEPVESEHNRMCPMFDSERITTLCVCSELDAADRMAEAEAIWDAINDR